MPTKKKTVDCDAGCGVVFGFVIIAVVLTYALIWGGASVGISGTRPSVKHLNTFALQSSHGPVYVMKTNGRCTDDGYEPINNITECKTAAEQLNETELPGRVSQTFKPCKGDTDLDCPDAGDHHFQGGPCWITGSSGSLKFSTRFQSSEAGEDVGKPCGFIEPYNAYPNTCICRHAGGSGHFTGNAGSSNTGSSDTGSTGSLLYLNIVTLLAPLLLAVWLK